MIKKAQKENKIEAPWLHPLILHQWKLGNAKLQDHRIWARAVNTHASDDDGQVKCSVALQMER